MKNILFRVFVVMVFVLGVASAFAIKVIKWNYTDYSKNFKCSHCQQIVDVRDKAFFSIQMRHLFELLERLMKCSMGTESPAVQELMDDCCQLWEWHHQSSMTYSDWTDIAQCYDVRDFSEFDPHFGAFLIQAMKVYADTNLVDKT